MNKLSFKGKILAAFGAIFFGVLITGFIAMYSLLHIINAKQDLDGALDAVAELAKVRADHYKTEVLILQSVSLGSGELASGGNLDDLEEIAGQRELRLQNLEELLSEMPEMYPVFVDVRQRFERLHREQSVLIEALGRERVIDDVTTEAVKSLGDYAELRRQLSHLDEMLNAEADRLMAESDRVVLTGRILLTLVMLIVMIVCLVAIVRIIRMIGKIAAEMKEGISVVGTSVEEIHSTVAEISTGATETSTAISETTTTVEEIRQTAVVANSKANGLMERSQKAVGTGEKGLESSQLMIDAMNRIDAQMQLIHATITNLAEKNKAIAEITTTVADIADQSNLLAVNAAIEAAKAGEYGRGFSVVAQEIRNLAVQSKKSTVEVKDILDDIQRSVAKAADVIRDGTLSVDEGKLMVAEDREVVELLIDNINESMEAAIQISSSSHQQLAGMEQIVPAMENIRQASEQNVAGIRQAQDVTRSLGELGESLRGMIERFRL